jgi:hypothetical protein
MQPNALLGWQNFIMQKVSVTDIPPLKRNLTPRFGCGGNELYVVCSEFFFILPSSFIFGVVTPLYLAHLDDLSVSHSLCVSKILIGLSESCSSLLFYQYLLF